MRAVCLGLACALFLLPSDSLAAGLAVSQNFIVLAPDQPLAEDVLDAAEGLRKQIALDWLGAELPTGKGQTGIGVFITDSEDRGMTWPIDDPKRKLHRIWMRTSRDGAVSTILAHEVTHVVFAIHLLGTLPTWANEGIASLNDGEDRVAIRKEIVAGYTRSGQWPDLAKILNAENFSTSDQESYAVAVSLVQYLLTRGDRLTVVRFALSGRKEGWEAAARQYYGFRTVAELQAAWQQWAARGDTAAVATSLSAGRPADHQTTNGS